MVFRESLRVGTGGLISATTRVVEGKTVVADLGAAVKETITGCQVADYHRAYGACLQGKGHSVEQALLERSDINVDLRSDFSEQPQMGGR